MANYKQLVAGPRIRRVVLPITAFVMLVLGFLAYIGLFNGNVRTVVPGRVYRSAQLNPRQLTALIHERGIRTVISLRGGTPNDHWWSREAEACRQEGVELKTISLRATVLPPPAELRELLTTFDHAQYPILFHCKGGADRSGLAATIYLNAYAGVPFDQAQHEGLTWRYGHLKWTARAMDDFFDLYRREAGNMDLRNWIAQRYPAIYAANRGKERVVTRSTSRLPAGTF